MPNIARCFVALCGLTASIGCAGASRARCPPVPAKYLDTEGPAFPACGVDIPVKPLKTFTMPSDFRPTQSCGNAVVEFVVGVDGTPVRETAQVVRSNEPLLAERMLLDLATWRYVPAMKGGVPVRQLTRFSMTYSVAAGTTAAVSRPRLTKC